MNYISNSSMDTFLLGKSFGEKAKKGDIFCLSGNLGSGKTVFAKGFAKGLSIEENVDSPTFTIIHEYEGRLPLYHFDVYRIEDPDEMEETGLLDYLFGDGVCLIEWAEIIKDLIPESSYFVKIDKDPANENKRIISVEGNYPEEK